MEPTGGIELLQEMKKHRPRALVMMMTGLGTIDLAVEAMKKGADEFVTKPFQIKALSGLVEQLFDERLPRPPSVGQASG